MTTDPGTMSDPKQARQLRKNAERLNATEMATACSRRLFELGCADLDAPVERQLVQAATAVAETHRAKHGRAQAAGYIRRTIAITGAVATLSYWALKPSVAAGSIALVEGGMARFTGEYVVAEFSDRFQPHVLAAAREHLHKHGVKLTPGESHG